MRFMLILLVIGILVFFSYYMFVAEEFKGSPKTQVQQAFGIKEKEDSTIEIEVQEIATKFGLTGEEHAAQRQFIKEYLVQEKQKIAVVLKDKSLAKQQQSEKIMQIQKRFHQKIAFTINLNEGEEGKRIQQWLMSRESNMSDNNIP